MNNLAAEANKTQIQFFSQLFSAEDESEFKQQILAVIRKLGFSDFCYGLPPARFGLYGNVACSWELLPQFYTQNKGSDDNMILLHCENSVKSVFASTVEAYISGATFKCELLSHTAEFIDFFKLHGYHDVYFISYKTLYTCSSNALFLVMAKYLSQAEFRNLVKESKSVLLLLAEAVDFVGATKFSELYNKITPRKNKDFPPKPLRLLSTMVDNNLTIKGAAEKLCISLDTANKHMASAKKALGAKTQAVAVYNALKLGLISCGE